MAMTMVYSPQICWLLNLSIPHLGAK
uniref:Uncharacterized protein n=1 Tax=Arundo donax TaxID=35708 RepID=A0A0A9BNE7_ARUDO